MVIGFGKKGPMVQWQNTAFVPPDFGACSIVVIRRIRIAETGIRFPSGPQRRAPKSYGIR